MRLIQTATHDTAASLPTLRAYQKECIDKCLNELALGTKRQIVSLPVGSGKTVVMANLLKKIPDPTSTARKTLILAHRTELLEQACNQIKRFHPDWNVVIDQGKRKPDIESADVVIASVQTLARTGSERLARYDPKLFKTIMIDEVHHAAAKTYVRVLDHFQSLSKESHVFVWGCSATVRRHDGVGLEGIFDEIVYHKDLLQMIEEKWLCPVKVTTIGTSVDLSKVSIRNDDFSTSQLATAVNTSFRNDVIFHSWQQLAANERKSTLVFAVDMAHTVALCNHFRSNGVEAEFITSRTPAATRQETLDKFKRGEIPVMVNCGILTEGTDIPRVDCILMARPTRSAVLFQQMFGRGMRLHPDKQDCLVIDFVDNFDRTGKEGLVTFPTLMGLDYRHMVKDTSLLELEKLAEGEEQAKQQKSRLVYKENEDEVSSLNIPNKDSIVVTITEYDDLGNVNIETSGSPELRRISRNCWVSVGDDLCALQVLRLGTLVVRRNGDVYWTGTFQPIVFDGKKRQYLRPQTLPMVADTRLQAIRAADTWIQQYLTERGQGALLRLLSPSAKFRSDPASESQMQVLQQRYKIKTNKELTKGQAMDLLVRLQYGQSRVWRQQIKQQLEAQSKAQTKRERAVLLRAAR